MDDINCYLLTDHKKKLRIYYQFKDVKFLVLNVKTLPIFL